MPYIDEDYYKDEYKGLPVPEGLAFERLAMSASRVIDFLTNHRLEGSDFSKWPELIQSYIKKATAAQVEYLITSGETKAMGSGDYGQVTAGNFSYGDKAGSDALSREQDMTSAAVIMHLRPTGLLYQGVGVRG